MSTITLKNSNPAIDEASLTSAEKVIYGRLTKAHGRIKALNMIHGERLKAQLLAKGDKDKTTVFVERPAKPVPAEAVAAAIEKAKGGFSPDVVKGIQKLQKEEETPAVTIEKPKRGKANAKPQAEASEQAKGVLEALEGVEDAEQLELIIKAAKARLKALTTPAKPKKEKILTPAQLERKAKTEARLAALDDKTKNVFILATAGEDFIALGKALSNLPMTETKHLIKRLNTWIAETFGKPEVKYSFTKMPAADARDELEKRVNEAIRLRVSEQSLAQAA